MLTKNIKFKNFEHKANKSKYNFLKKIINLNNLLIKYPLLNSLTNKYKYNYKKKKLIKLKKFSEYNILGMGGSILGAETIYSFLKIKIKKKIFFF